MKLIEVAARPEPVLSMVNVSVEDWPRLMLAGENALVKAGCGTTVSVSLALPELPRDEVRSPVVLTRAPAVAAVTSTAMIQLAEAATAPPE